MKNRRIPANYSPRAHRHYLCSCVNNYIIMFAISRSVGLSLATRLVVYAYSRKVVGWILFWISQGGQNLGQSV